ncbi:MAG: signal peptidase II [Eggerthellaceae bacterium]|nr:signal peptidase II [Eggerthellaceae bacterium]
MASSDNNAVTKRTVLLAVLVVIWVLLDQFTKSLVAGQELGKMFAGPFLGLIDFKLVHNTGGAWGIFEGNTVALGVFSLVVCALLLAYYIWQRREVNLVQTVGIGLIMAGGIGNAIDRFVQGYVIDFIEFSFFDFPVFNVADIGVTCGFVILFIGLALAWRNESKDES